MWSGHPRPEGYPPGGALPGDLPDARVAVDLDRLRHGRRLGGLGHWLGLRRKEFAAGTNTRSGRTYRIMNEVPTLLMVVIVAAVIVKF